MKNLYRGVLYCIGLILLALGLILNTKTGLGVAPVITIPYSISNIWGVNLGNATLCIYILCVFGQMILRGKKFRSFDLLQIPMSVIFSRIMNIFNDMISINSDSLVINLILLVVAIILTGIGVAMSVEMKVVPNAADGLAHAIAEKTGKGLGLGKNILDISCAVAAVVIGIVFSGKIVGIGLGTLAAMLFVGRVIALFNKFFKEKMYALVAKEE